MKRCRYNEWVAIFQEPLVCPQRHGVTTIVSFKASLGSVPSHPTPSPHLPSLTRLLNILFFLFCYSYCPSHHCLTSTWAENSEIFKWQKWQGYSPRQKRVFPRAVGRIVLPTICYCVFGHNAANVTRPCQIGGIVSNCFQSQQDEKQRRNRGEEGVSGAGCQQSERREEGRQRH